MIRKCFEYGRESPARYKDFVLLKESDSAGHDPETQYLDSLVKQSVTIKLAGQSLNLRTKDESGYVRSLAEHLEERIDEIRQGAKSASAHQVALLAGLRVVDELFQAQRELDELRNSVESRVGRVLNVLDEHGLN